MTRLVNKEIFVKEFVIDNSDNFKHPVLVLGYRFIADYTPSEKELKNLPEDVYLMPFRKYQMHITASINGIHTCGQGPVIGLRHVTDILNVEDKPGWGYESNYNRRGIVREILEGLAMQAIIHLQNNMYGSGCVFRTDFRDTETIDEWAESVIDFLLGEGEYTNQ